MPAPSVQPCTKPSTLTRSGGTANAKRGSKSTVSASSISPVHRPKTLTSRPGASGSDAAFAGSLTRTVPTSAARPSSSVSRPVTRAASRSSARSMREATRPPSSVIRPLARTGVPISGTVGPEMPIAVSSSSCTLCPMIQKRRMASSRRVTGPDTASITPMRVACRSAAPTTASARTTWPICRSRAWPGRPLYSVGVLSSYCSRSPLTQMLPKRVMTPTNATCDPAGSGVRPVPPMPPLGAGKGDGAVGDSR